MRKYIQSRVCLFGGFALALTVALAFYKRQSYSSGIHSNVNKMKERFADMYGTLKVKPNEMTTTTRLSDTSYVNHVANDGQQGGVCRKGEYPTLNKDLSKIQSYKFPPAIDAMMTYLFPENKTSENVSWPVFVTAFSANHFAEGLALIKNFMKFQPTFPQKTILIVYDIGLTQEQHSSIHAVCDCDVRHFPFDNFPNHIRVLKGYAWKPLVMQLIAKEHGFVSWIDASFRLHRKGIVGAVKTALKTGIIATPGSGTIAQRTHENTFAHLHENPCTFSQVPEVPTGFVIVRSYEHIVEHIMKPWVACSLTLGCVVPNSQSDRYLLCPLDGPILHRCHRFEQSVLGILMHRNFGANIDQFIIKPGFYSFCRNCKE